MATAGPPSPAHYTSSKDETDPADDLELENGGTVSSLHRAIGIPCIVQSFGKLEAVCIIAIHVVTFLSGHYRHRLYQGYLRDDATFSFPLILYLSLAGPLITIWRRYGIFIGVAWQRDGGYKDLSSRIAPSES